MAVVTWTFTTNYEGWTFGSNDVPADEVFFGKTFAGSAVRTHVSGAIGNTLTVPDLIHVLAVGSNYSPILNAAAQNGDTIAVDYSSTTFADMDITIEANYDDDTQETASISNSIAGTLTLTITVNKTLDYIRVRLANSTSASAIGFTNARDIEEVRLTTAVPIVGTGQMPLGIDVDLESGSKVYVTTWDGDLGGDLLLKEYNSSIALQNTYTIADNTATIIDIGNRTFFLSPYTPPFFGTANLGDIIYIYGRWDDGAVKHLAKSTNGGAGFSNIGDSGVWGADWVGAFFADDANILYAFVNGGSPALYRSLNAGTNWTNLSVLPFDIDPHGVSKHPDGRILIANRINGAQMVAYADSAYSAWTNATGSPSFPTAGGGARSIIWVT